MVSETRDASNFNTIKVEYPAQVTVTQGAKESVKIEADDNLLPDLQTRVRGNTLEIFYKVNDDKHVNPTKPVNITALVRLITPSSRGGMPRVRSAARSQGGPFPISATATMATWRRSDAAMQWLISAL